MLITQLIIEDFYQFSFLIHQNDNLEITYIQFEDKDYKLQFDTRKDILKVCKLLKKFSEEKNDIQNNLIDIERDTINGIVLIIKNEKRIAIHEVQFEILLELAENISNNISNSILLK